MISVSTRNQILDTVKRLGKASVSEVLDNLPQKRSRQWVSTLLNQLSREGALVRAKSGKFAFYVLPDRIDLIDKKLVQKLTNQNLNEDIVFDNFVNQLPFLRKLPEDLTSILRYAFTEMLNNAIEHSHSESVEVSLEEHNPLVTLQVRDWGIGVYKSIMGKAKLASELEAIQELLKGKTTTLPHSHSGEGIFFTSKIADLFILDSFQYRLRIDNHLRDVFVEKIDSLPGTLVKFVIDKHTQKHLNDVFIEYQAEPGSYSFDKTNVHVKLFQAGTVYISRSQARRLMANLDKFKHIVLDFSGINTIGQAFADEVFRVFASRHPDIKIQPVNMSETVEFMIKRVPGVKLSMTRY
jgi:predicted transcriptional regulator